MKRCEVKPACRGKKLEAFSIAHLLVDLSVRVLFQPLCQLTMLHSRYQLRPRLRTGNGLRRSENGDGGDGRVRVGSREERRLFLSGSLLLVRSVPVADDGCIDLVGVGLVVEVGRGSVGGGGLDKFERGEIEDECPVDVESLLDELGGLLVDLETAQRERRSVSQKSQKQGRERDNEPCPSPDRPRKQRRPSRRSLG